MKNDCCLNRFFSERNIASLWYGRKAVLRFWVVLKFDIRLFKADFSAFWCVTTQFKTDIWNGLTSLLFYQDFRIYEYFRYPQFFIHCFYFCVFVLFLSCSFMGSKSFKFIIRKSKGDLSGLIDHFYLFVHYSCWYEILILHRFCFLRRSLS